MDWILDLFTGTGVAHSIFIYSLVIALGVMLGKIKFFGISLGATFVLFVGLLAGHLGCTIDPGTLKFIQEFGLILFIFSIGLQVGPSFFSSFKHGGLTLNALAMAIIALNIVVALIIFFIDPDLKAYELVGVLGCRDQHARTRCRTANAHRDPGRQRLDDERGHVDGLCRRLSSGRGGHYPLYDCH